MARFSYPYSCQTAFYYTKVPLTAVGLLVKDFSMRENAELDPNRVQRTTEVVSPALINAPTSPLSIAWSST